MITLLCYNIHVVFYQEVGICSLFFTDPHFNVAGNNLSPQNRLDTLYTQCGNLNCVILHSWGPNRVFGETEDLGFLSVKKVKKKFLAK